MDSRVVRPDVPEHVQQTIERLLAKAPAGRFQSASELLVALDRSIAAADVVRGLPVRDGQSERRRRRTWLVAGVGAIAGAAALVAMTLSGDSGSGGAALGPDPKKIAVLYLDAPDGDTALATIARGITRDLIYSLGRVSDLQLITENGVRALGARAAPDSVARILGVGTVIAGSIDRVRDSLQLDLRLVDVRTLVEKAAVRGRYATNELLSMRDTAVREVARELLRTIGREVQSYGWRSETRSSEAWQSMQRARDLIEYANDLPSNPADFGPQLRLLAAAERLFDSAQRMDLRWEEPVIERGWSMLRRFQLNPPAESGALLDSLSTLVRTAVGRWPASARGQELRGTLEFQRLKDGFDTSPALRDSAEADLRAATASDRRLARAWLTLAGVLNRKGDSAGSILATRRALEADGYGRDVHRIMMTLVQRYLYRRQNDSARAYCAYVRGRFPTDSYVQSCELSVLGWTGSGTADVASIWRALDRTERAGAFPLEGGIFPVGRYWAAAVLARSSLRDSARAVLTVTSDRLRTIGHAGYYPMNEAQVRLILGERDTALALLDSAIRRDPAKRSMVAALPWFDALHPEPRFRELVNWRSGQR